MLDLSRITERALEDILREREAQDREWGGPVHDDGHSHYDWVDYLEKKLVSAWKAAAVGTPDSLPVYRRRLVQVAALAIAALESFDRKHPNDAA